jgi:hypothetical protein
LAGIPFVLVSLFLGAPPPGISFGVIISLVVIGLVGGAILTAMVGLGKDMLSTSTKRPG